MSMLIGLDPIGELGKPAILGSMAYPWSKMVRKAGRVASSTSF
jgi:hypothetical protein